jgi:hypothetical protein
MFFNRTEFRIFVKWTQFCVKVCDRNSLTTLFVWKRFVSANICVKECSLYRVRVLPDIYNIDVPHLVKLTCRTGFPCYCNFLLRLKTQRQYYGFLSFTFLMHKQDFLSRDSINRLNVSYTISPQRRSAAQPRARRYCRHLGRVHQPQPPRRNKVSQVYQQFLTMGTVRCDMVVWEGLHRLTPTKKNVDLLASIGWQGILTCKSTLCPPSRLHDSS